jgi:hypothetical protein
MPYFEYPDQQQHEYERASGQFTPDELEADARRGYEVLREVGVQTVYCSYNGGYDEGFAHFDAVELQSETIELDELKLRLAGGMLSSGTSEELQNYDSNREPWTNQGVDFYLESFANELAIRLLGSGYGTGEYSMRGSFKADLATGAIIDEQEQ